MKRIIPLAALVITTLAFAQAPAKESKTQDDNVQQTLTQLERELGAAAVKADLATFDRIFAPEWMNTGPDGTLINKAQSDADFKSGAFKCTAFKIDGLKINVFGDTAIVFGLETEKSTYNGKDTSGQYRYTDVFVKRAGKWVVVATQWTKVAKP
jgi:ketosteroid isomerase-like protein